MRPSKAKMNKHSTMFFITNKKEEVDNVKYFDDITKAINAPVKSYKIQDKTKRYQLVHHKFMLPRISLEPGTFCESELISE